MSDSEPGLSDGQKNLASSRFLRVSRTSGDGSGLGLSIVQRIVDHYKARFLLENNLDGKGTVAKVIFPE